MSNADNKVLATAMSMVTKNRSKTHGTPEDNFNHTAALWSAYLGSPVTAHDVCQMMVLAKISRSKVGKSDYADHYVDQCGYSSLAARMVKAK
jgi:hypothetical protein